MMLYFSNSPSSPNRPSHTKRFLLPATLALKTTQVKLSMQSMVNYRGCWSPWPPCTPSTPTKTKQLHSLCRPEAGSDEKRTAKGGNTVYVINMRGCASHDPWSSQDVVALFCFQHSKMCRTRPVALVTERSTDTCPQGVAMQIRFYCESKRMILLYIRLGFLLIYRRFTIGSRDISCKFGPISSLARREIYVHVWVSREWRAPCFSADEGLAQLSLFTRHGMARSRISQ